MHSFDPCQPSTGLADEQEKLIGESESIAASANQIKGYFLGAA
jgi:hypothetical protein